MMLALNQLDFGHSGLTSIQCCCEPRVASSGSASLQVDGWLLTTRFSFRVIHVCSRRSTEHHRPKGFAVRQSSFCIFSLGVALFSCSLYLTLFCILHCELAVLSLALRDDDFARLSLHSPSIPGRGKFMLFCNWLLFL